MAPVVVDVVSEKLTLGEGPHWDQKNQCLYMVDIFGQYILKYVPSTGVTTKAKIDSGKVSLIVPVEGKSDQFLITIGLKVVIATWDGKSEKVSKLETLFELNDKNPDRFNDGKTDPTGRLWLGTMGPEPEIGKIDLNKGALYSLVGKNRLETHLTGVSIANGLAWDLGRKKMYYIDSPLRTVDQYDFDVEKGEIANKKAIFNFDHHDIPGVPDGMCIDTDGNLWVAVFNGSRILHVDPRTSQLLATIDMPASQITSVAFGGPSMDVLYATSAQLPQQGKVHTRFAGCCFQITGTGAKGQPGVAVKLQ